MDTNINTSLVKVEDRVVKIPVYHWEANKVSYISKRESVCIETWVKTMNVMACVRALKDEVGTEWGWQRVSSLLKRPRVSRVIAERLKKRAIASGLDREGWLAEGLKMQYSKDGGPNKMSWVFWKELGKAMGFYVEGEGMHLTQNFSIVQADGKV